MKLHQLVRLAAAAVAAVAVIASGADASAARRSRSRVKAKARTTAVKKNRRQRSASRYSSSRRSSGRSRSKGAKSVSVELPFSVSDRVYLAGTAASGQYVVYELLADVAKSVQTIAGGNGKVDGSFMASGEVFSVANTAYKESRACVLWGSKEITDLTGPATSNVAHAIWAYDDEIYIAGQSGHNAVLWVNAKAQVLDDGRSDALDVCYANKQTYCCGFSVDDSGAKHGRIWSSGGSVQLPAAGLVSVNAILVDGSDVNIAGVEQDGASQLAVAYAGQQRTVLKTDAGCVAVPSSIDVRGGNVYVVGTVTAADGTAHPALWINGEPQDISALQLATAKVMRAN